MKVNAECIQGFVKISVRQENALNETHEYFRPKMTLFWCIGIYGITYLLGTDTQGKYNELYKGRAKIYSSMYFQVIKYNIIKKRNQTCALNIYIFLLNKFY